VTDHRAAAEQLLALPSVSGVQQAAQMQAHALLAIAESVAELVMLLREHLAPVEATPEAPAEPERLLLLDRENDLWIGTAGGLRCTDSSLRRTLAEVIDRYGPVQPLTVDEFLARLR